MIAISLGLFTPLLAVTLQHLPDALIGAASDFLDFSSLQALSRNSNRFRNAVGFLDLDRELSRSYIYNAGGYRDHVNGARAMPHTRTRLNLGEDFRTYMVDAEFRARVDALAASPLQQIWSDVTRLDLSGTPIQNISPLAGLVNLQVLYLRHPQVHDISPLAELVNLQTLELSYTRVHDITPLAGLVNLQRLCLPNTQVQDISPLAGLVNLQVLNLVRTQVQVISPLAGLLNLQELNLSYTKVQDIRPLAGLVNLQTLDLQSTQVQDIRPLAGLVNLQYLYLSDTQVQVISPLAELVNLQTLHLYRTQVSGVSVVELQHTRPLLRIDRY